LSAHHRYRCRSPLFVVAAAVAPGDLDHLDPAIGPYRSAADRSSAKLVRLNRDPDRRVASGRVITW
jgi:hypothetical protein